MQKYLKASTTVLVIALGSMLALSEAAIAKNGGNGGGDRGGNAGQSEGSHANSGNGGSHGNAGYSAGGFGGQSQGASGLSDAGPGNTGSMSGFAATTPGRSGATPANGAAPPGLARTAPGLAGTTPGHMRRAANEDLGSVPTTGAVTRSGALARLDDDVPGSREGSMARRANFGSLISSLNHSTAQVQQLRSLSNVGNITFVDASSLTRGARAKALNNALSRSRISDLRDALSSNATVASTLAANNVSLDDVLSASVTADGGLVVYTR